MTETRKFKQDIYSDEVGNQQTKSSSVTIIKKYQTLKNENINTPNQHSVLSVQ